MTTGNEYCYPRFRREMLLGSGAFRDGPAPGEPMPDFDLPAAAGGRVRRDDFTGRRPFLQNLSSIT